MKKEIVILGSTGSIGNSTLKSIEKQNNFIIKLLTTHSNIKKVFKQAKKFKVKNVIVENEKKYREYKFKFQKNKIKLHLGFKNINKVLKKKVLYCVNSISGIDGLEPTLHIIPFTKNILIANKESIICGWDLISKQLKKHNTKFIPVDSEHYAIWKLIKYEDYKNIDKIILTASGGPFLNINKQKISNIKPEQALKHPNWNMGKKISIDSSTMMNKVFEFIEAKKIFNIDKKNLSILIHPTSFVHAIIFFNSGIIKFLAHDTKMTIPISSALEIKLKNKTNKFDNYLKNLNNMKFIKPREKQFPLLSVINMLPDKNSFFETILITLNDDLVHKYLNGEINYISIQKNILSLINRPFLKKFYKLKPKNIYDIKNMIMITKNYISNNLKYYEK